VVPLELRVPPVASAVADARHAAAAWLSGLGAFGRHSDDVLLVVSELVSNGVMHNGGDDIVVTAQRTPGCVHLDVVTTPRPRGTPPYSRPDAEVAATGRGLGIVAALCQHVSIHTEPGGRRTVTCSIDVPD
jgi:anti-sigma regulatory factor (Ser/Thr protein kinase)